MARSTCPVAALVCAVLLVSTGCGDDSPTGPTSNAVGPEGGTFTFAGGDVTLVVPPGAVSREITVIVQTATSFPASPRLVAGTVYDLQPGGTVFAQPVALTIRYDAASLPTGVLENELALNEVVGAGWQDVTASTVDEGSNTVTGSINGFSAFGVLGVPVTGVTVAPISATIQIGEPVQLAATATDVAANELPSRPITWASSSPTIATVSSEGLVTGVAIGQATISATSEGEAGNAAITVTAQGQPVLELVALGLSGGVYVTAPPGDTTRIFIVQLTGRVLIARNGSILPVPYLDIQSIVSGSGEQGLFSMAFHPNYSQNGEFFVDYTDVNGDTRVARYRVSADPDVADPGSGEIILAVGQPFSNHNGGQIAFGPDGMLYIALGDGGSQNDPQGHGQDRSTLLATLLRIDVDGGTPYAIPTDNPFVGDAAARDEIWAYGLRNPWRFSFDRNTGDLYIADVGQNQIEEVDVQPVSSGGGENYGWNTMEGSNCFIPANCDQTGLVLPVLEYTHADGCSVTGGYVYRGTRVPALAGHYLYADFCSGFVRSFRYESGQAVNLQDWTNALSPGGQISSFGEDARGELYIITLSGSVHRIAALIP